MLLSYLWGKKYRQTTSTGWRYREFRTWARGDDTVRDAVKLERCLQNDGDWLWQLFLFISVG